MVLEYFLYATHEQSGHCPNSSVIFPSFSFSKLALLGGLLVDSICSSSWLLHTMEEDDIKQMIPR